MMRRYQSLMPLLSLLCFFSLLSLVSGCTRHTLKSPPAQATSDSSAAPSSFTERLKPLGSDVARCLLHLILELKVPDVELTAQERREASYARSERCVSLLYTQPQLSAPLTLWAIERLKIGGDWGNQTEASHTLRMLTWNLNADVFSSELGVLTGGRWVRWTRRGVERGTLERSPPRYALSLVQLKRPDKPSAERGGWWAHLGLWLPLHHLGYELSFTHPQGWPVGAFGPKAYATKRFASLKERRWWIPASSKAQGRVLYLSLTPSWAQLSRWAWTQLTEPLSGPHHHVALQEGAKAAHSGLKALDAWLKTKVRYHYSPLRRYQPRPPHKSLQLGYGDCKDLSAIAHVALAEAGRPSWFALTSQRPILSSARAIPSMGWFDHVLLWAPSADELRVAQLTARVADSERPLPSSPMSAWFDPTGPSGSARALRGRWAYVLLSPDQGRWVQIGGLSLSGAFPTPQ